MAFEDNTAVLRMKRDFEQFAEDHRDSIVPAFKYSHLDDDTTSLQAASKSDVISVQALLEKEKQFKQKEQEYIAAKNQIVRLESKLNSIETSNKRARLDLDQRCEALQNDRLRDAQKIEDLSFQLAHLKTRYSQSQEALEEAKHDATRAKSHFQEQLAVLHKEKQQVVETLQQEIEQLHEKNNVLKRDLMRNDTELKICQCELEETKTQLKLQQKRLSDFSTQMTDCEALKATNNQAELKIKDLELQISRMQEDGIVAKAMKTQMTTYQDVKNENRQLKEENQYLKDIQENNLLLKEQNESLKKKLERMDEKITEYARLLAENEELKERLNKWECADKVGTKLRSPSDLSKMVTELQNSELLMLSKQGELQSGLHLKEAKIKELQQLIHRQQQQTSVEKTKNQQNSDLIKRLQRKLLLVTKERDGYKNIIDSYESEVTVNISSENHTRVKLMEESMMGYKKQTELLEAELSKVSDELGSARKYSKQLEQKIQELQQEQSNGGATSQVDQQAVVQLREKIAALEKALEKCEEEKFTLECRIEQRHLQGDYDPTKLKVIHFKMNPVEMATSQRAEELKRLTEENLRLKQRIKLLEENQGQLEDLTVQVEQRMREPGSSKDIEEMRTQLTTAELKNKRLMEAFKKTSQEVREVCYQLTGYKIDIPTSNQYRLTSMYADSPADFLLFQQNTPGEIQMLATSFSSTLQPLMEMYLMKQDSIPAFLSSVTLELFSRQTKNFG